MIVVILCGGSGTRMHDYSFPKPLNMIYGKPSITYTLKNLPEGDAAIHFIVAPHLHTYNFKEIVTNAFRHNVCIFHDLPYFTRGAVESAWLGTKELPDSDEPMVFLDNDVIYDFPRDFFESKPSAFLGYAKDNTGSESYSFMKLNEGGFVTDFKEKVRISNTFCCGVYGFQNIRQFREVASAVINVPKENEMYMSSLFTWMICKSIPITGVEFKNTIHVGSIAEVERDIALIPKRIMRVCFDLDNTLVTYPSVATDYSTVKPVPAMINLAHKLKREGHTIIIHTARRMETHKCNVGAVIKDIGHQTFKTLEEFNIPYDELMFGKPIADMYIDDRAINPYRNDMRCMGLIDYKEPVAPVNMIGTNKYNNIEIVDNFVRKRGPARFINGEAHFYSNIPRESAISEYFPKYFGKNALPDDEAEIYIEHIRGVPLYTLFKNQLLTEDHINSLLEFTDMLHNTVGNNAPTRENVACNYIQKLTKRFSVTGDYPFDNATSIQESCISRLSEYVKKDLVITPFIHGDLWFSNAILDFKNKLKLIDMKGQVNDIYTTGGDVMYDYGKLYQSFLGYDMILYNDTIPEEYIEKTRSMFIEKVKGRGVCIADLKTVTFSLIVGTFHSIKNIETRTRVWNWLTQLLSGELKI